jgi:hypothetical protein
MHLKDNYVYLGFPGKELKHPKLVSEGRKTIKVFKCFVNKDIDLRSLDQILEKACLVIDKKIRV